MFEAITRLDFAILDWIQSNIKCAFLDVLASCWRFFGEAGIFWIAIAIGLMITKKYRKLGITLALSFAIGALTVNLGLKPLVGRVRPYDVNTGINVLIPHLSDYSFPSGHTLICAEAAAVLWHFERRFGIPAAICAVIMAFSRVYLYVHYPSDVLVGLILGAVNGIIAISAVNAIWKRRGSYTKTNQDLSNGN